MHCDKLDTSALIASNPDDDFRCSISHKYISEHSRYGGDGSDGRTSHNLSGGHRVGELGCHRGLRISVGEEYKLTLDNIHQAVQNIEFPLYNFFLIS